MTVGLLSTDVRWTGRGDGFELWSGPSQIDGSPIGVVVTHLHLRNRPLNGKIGNMSQAWILPRDVEPNEAVRTGDDASVCGTCRFRPENGGGCYVRVPQTAQRVWWTWRVHGTYRPAPVLPERLALKSCRIGAWGDPAAVPLEVWERLTAALPGWTAYTHRWSVLDVREWGWCMASADSEAEAAEAQRQGWRTYRARGEADPIVRGEITCPAALEARTHATATCASCGLCDGVRLPNNGLGIKTQPKNLTIIVHGRGYRAAARAVAAK